MVKKILLLDVELDKKSLAGQLEKNWTHYPTGILYLAAVLNKEFPMIEVKVFHTPIYNDSICELKKILTSYKPDLVGFRALSIFKEQFFEHVFLCKTLLPEVFLVAGGPYPSISYNEILEKTPIDIVVMGEGEETIVEIVNSINDTGEISKNIQGTVVKKNQNIYKNAERKFIGDLDCIPFPDYSLIDINSYKGLTNHAFGKTDKCGYILSSRGCPYNCFYCHQLFGKKVRRRSPNNIVEEMKEKYYEFGIKEFVFLDDIFNVPLRTCKETLKLMLKDLPNDITLNFPNGLRADCIDFELVDLLGRCGMKSIALAVESASPCIQNLIGKRLDLDKAFKNIDAISREFITTVFYMIGFPTETYEEAESTIEFAHSLKYVAQPVLSVLRVYENTKIYDFLQPNDSQKEYIKKQEMMALQTKLWDDLWFYGDVFDSKVVPLNSKLINKLRLKWVKSVMLNKERLNNANKILKHFLSEEEIQLFYKDMFDDDKIDIKEILKEE